MKPALPRTQGWKNCLMGLCQLPKGNASSLLLPSDEVVSVAQRSLKGGVSTKMECNYFFGWIKKRGSHMQKSHPKMGDLAGKAEEEEEGGEEEEEQGGVVYPLPILVSGSAKAELS